MDAADPHTLIQRALNQARQDSAASLAREREELRRQLMEHKKWVAENAAGRRKAEAALAAERKITTDRVEVASGTVDAVSRAVDAVSRTTDAARELVRCVAECQATNDNGVNDDSGETRGGCAVAVVETSLTRDSATAKCADAPSAAKAPLQRGTAVVRGCDLYPPKPKADASASGTAGKPVKLIPGDLLTRKRKVDASASVDTQVSGMTRSGADLGRVLNNKRTKWDSDEDAYE
ncbi:hypothetical protein DFH07DRAFT_1061214 [Mycena maculata]|uniref:Uncharacterized protein n=1 Tax=Mycena maculata TaxID=230809 RepID=A0AAD7NBF7_9AGAR|nr:hypothetical protein DFH07DRAFT_1061214 [Mycena maculata]